MNSFFYIAVLTITVSITVIATPSSSFAEEKAQPQSKSRFNSNDPIEITSDKLQVDQLQNIAVFTGNVVAIQKDVRLKSDIMTVYYLSQEEKQKDQAQKSPERNQQSIKKIDVEGNVFLTTPQETASGNRGDYDVSNNEIHIYDNVVLTQGQNVLKGNALTYNFQTERSVMTGGAIATQGASKGNQRVRALFVPEKSDSENKNTTKP